jgi:hypothetical protein
VSTCVPIQALVSALARRLRDEGLAPPDREIEALLALGAPAVELAEALAATGAPAAGEAARRVWEIAGRR